MGWLDAFLLDLGLTLFYLVYGFGFNCLFDWGRRAWGQRVGRS
jgi:uncharacterized membrane protein